MMGEKLDTSATKVKVKEVNPWTSMFIFSPYRGDAANL